MEYIPWFAWIAIMGVLVWGVIQVVNITKTRGAARGSQEELKHRIEALEHRFLVLEQERRSPR